MSSDGTYPTRASRRADRDRPPASRASAGTAAALLILAAIIGFGGGGIAGTMSGSGDAAAADNGEVTTDTGTSPEATSDNSAEDDPEEGPAEAVPGEGVTLTSEQDGTEVPSGESGRIYIQGSTSPPVADVVLTIERSLDGGQTWGDAGSSRLTTTTRDDGTFESSFWSGREGENRYRVVGESPDGQRLESNPIIVTVVGG